MDKVIFGERAPVERNCRTRSGIPLVLLNSKIRPDHKHQINVFTMTPADPSIFIFRVV